MDSSRNNLRRISVRMHLLYIRRHCMYCLHHILCMQCKECDADVYVRVDMQLTKCMVAHMYVCVGMQCMHFMF